MTGGGYACSATFGQQWQTITDLVSRRFVQYYLFIVSLIMGPNKRQELVPQLFYRQSSSTSLGTAKLSLGEDCFFNDEFEIDYESFVVKYPGTAWVEPDVIPLCRSL